MVDALHQEPKGSACREAARGRLLGVWQRCAPFVLSACIVSTKKNKPELSRHMALVVTENVGFLVRPVVAHSIHGKGNAESEYTLEAQERSRKAALTGCSCRIGRLLSTNR